MRIIRGHRFLKKIHKACILAIGNFDGVHIGHQALLKHLVNTARETNLPAVVMTFEPLPREFFASNSNAIPARLTRLREKVLLFKKQAVDTVMVVPFNQSFATLSKDDFIYDWLVAKLGVQRIIVGNDFCFGYKRCGNFAYLSQMAKKIGFKVITMPAINVNHQRVSSTWVRKCLAQDNLAQAKRLLGRHYAMVGRVAHGAKLGRQLGYPTANIDLHRAKTPLHGIYAVTVDGLAPRPLPGVADLGERPAVGGSYTLLEVFIFDFDCQIYHLEVKVSFIKKLRNEQHYDSLAQLRAQIARDVIAARAFFAATKVTK